MLSKELAPVSLGGGVLPGGNVVRIVYMDEAGRGNVEEEPHFVVACAITSPDAQWHKLRRHYADLANDVLALSGEGAHDEYVFQAKHVWHGSGDFPRSKFSRDDRLRLLERLAQVPALYNIPIAVSIIDRKGLHSEFPETSMSGKRVLEHAYAYAIALQYVDSWMESHCPGEVVMVIAEDTDEVKETVRWFHDGLKKTDEYDEFYDREYFVTKTVVDAVHFSPKNRSPILQIADHAAFMAKRVSVGCPLIKPAWRHLSPQLVRTNKHRNTKIRMKIPLRFVQRIEENE